MKKYIVAPHDHARNMFHNALGMTVNAWNKNKRRIDPVFKSERQRKSFKRFSNLHRTTLRRNIAANPWGGPGIDIRLRELRAANKLNKLAQPRSALRSFDGDNQPKVFVQGHGAPGSLNITDDAGYVKTVRQTSMTLKRLGIPGAAEVRANSCWSGTQHNIAPLIALGHLARGNQSMSPDSGNALNTFAGSLANELRTVGRTLPNIGVAGYLGPTTQSPTQAIKMNPVPAPNSSMAVGFMDPLVPAPGQFILSVKRDNAKRTF